VQLQNAQQRFAAQGIKLAAISYDTQAILRDFARRRGIDFPLLADPDSKIIRSFHVLNETATGRAKGVAFPGFFYIDANGVIREKFFEAYYANRFTANNVVAKLFPELTEDASHKVKAPHLQLALAQSDRSVIPGSRISLTINVTLPPDIHVYAHNAMGYKPMELIIRPAEDIDITSASYPSPKVLYLAATREPVPVFEGKFRIVQDVRIASSDAMLASLGDSGRTLWIVGELKYQACDQGICYPPTSAPVNWHLLVLPLDYHRPPKDIRHN
jgi:hypothetical protein